MKQKLRFGIHCLIIVVLMPLSLTASKTILVDTVPLLFVDDSGIEEVEFVERTLHPAKTRSEPVLMADQPWEGERVYVYGSIFHDHDEGYFHMWYFGAPEPTRRSPLELRSVIREPENHIPSLKYSDDVVSLYAVSKDGISWMKPALGLHAYDGNDNTNILLGLKAQGVLIDSFEKDPARKFKMMGKVGSAYLAAYSPDGINWTYDPENPLLHAYSDAMTLAQDPLSGEYLLYHKRNVMVRGHVRRSVILSRSRDFRTWREVGMVFTADEQDDAWVHSDSQRTEVYNMSVYPHAAGFIGLPSLFRVTNEFPREQVNKGQSPHDGPMDIQLVTSFDGENWERTWPRINMIPRGSPGTFDGGAIFSVSGNLVHHGDETWIYYTAINTGHGSTVPPKTMSIGRAEWRLHGFASLDTGPEGGRIVTKPVQFGNSLLLINADARNGHLKVGILEDNGNPVPGYELHESDILNTNATAWISGWKGRHSVPTDRPLRVVIEMVNTRLFSLSTDESPIKPPQKLENSGKTE